MAPSTTFSPAITPSQLCSGKNGANPSWNVAVAKCGMIGQGKRMNVTCMAASVPADRVPDMGKRKLMNLLLLGAIALPSTGMLYPYIYFFVPPGGGGSSGQVAKDALGNDVIAEEWLKTHGQGDRTLTQGLKGDPTYLVVENDKTLAAYGINAVVPTLVVLCHGMLLRTSSSARATDHSTTTKGESPLLSLALAHANIDDGKVLFVPWVETDFRTGENPWWA